VGGREQGQQVGFGGRIIARMVDDLGESSQRRPCCIAKKAGVVTMADSDGDDGASHHG